MKIVTRNKRAPRRYSVFRSVSLLDEAGMVWANIYLRDGGISISYLNGVEITTNERNGMGDYDLDHEFNRGYWSSWCPECSRERSGGPSPQHIYDPKTDKVTCSVCGHTWENKEGGG